MKYVQTSAELQEAISALDRHPRLAVDTEADSLHRYSESLCLVQVSSPDDDYVIDPLAPLDLNPLARLLEKKEIVYHGADFDMRMLGRFYGYRAGKIFDTMIAAQLLGYTSQSLAALVERHFGVVLAKANQKADWSRRPLTESMIVYAANDTHYLEGLARIMQRELEDLDRLEWFRESCEYVVEAVKVPRETDTENRFRIKGSGDMSGKELVLLRAVWQWREKEAQRRDRPGFKVLNNDYMLDIVKWKIMHPQETLDRMPKLPSQLDAGRCCAVDEALTEAMALSPDTLPAVKRGDGPRRLTPEERDRVVTLKNERAQLAQELKCDPGILAPNATLETIIAKGARTLQDYRDLKCLKNWQAELIAARFQHALEEAAAKPPSEDPPAVC